MGKPGKPLIRQKLAVRERQHDVASITEVFLSHLIGEYRWNKECDICCNCAKGNRPYIVADEERKDCKIKWADDEAVKIFGKSEFKENVSQRCEKPK